MYSRRIHCDASRLLIGIVLGHKAALSTDKVLGLLQLVDKLWSEDPCVIGKALFVDMYDCPVRDQSLQFLPTRGSKIARRHIFIIRFTPTWLCFPIMFGRVRALCAGSHLEP